MAQKSWISLLTVLLLALPAELAFSQNASDTALERRVQRLEQDLNIMQRDYFRSAGNVTDAFGQTPVVIDDPGRAANIEVRIMSLESEIRTLTGLIEELGHRLNLQEQASTKLAEDIEFRLAEIEGLNTLASSDGVPSRSISEGSTAETLSIPPNLTSTGDDVSRDPLTPQQAALTEPADERYNSARRMIAQGRYEEAEAALLGLLQTFPESELAPNAQYWLGETYYVRQLYAEAAATFVAGMQQYGSSVKGPDYMLKLGMALIGMGNHDDGCAALVALPDRYRDAPEAIFERARSSRQRFQCP